MLLLEKCCVLEFMALITTKTSLLDFTVAPHSISLNYIIHDCLGTNAENPM